MTILHHLSALSWAPEWFAIPVLIVAVFTSNATKRQENEYDEQMFV
jgi:hypothetical protein